MSVNYCDECEEFYVRACECRKQDRVDRLEKIVRNLCSVILDDNPGFTWQPWADPLKDFLKETDPKKFQEKKDE